MPMWQPGESVYNVKLLIDFIKLLLCHCFTLKVAELVGFHHYSAMYLPNEK